MLLHSPFLFVPVLDELSPVAGGTVGIAVGGPGLVTTGQLFVSSRLGGEWDWFGTRTTNGSSSVLLGEAFACSSRDVVLRIPFKGLLDGAAVLSVCSFVPVASD